MKSLHGVQKACFRDIIEASFNIKKKDGKYILVVNSQGDVMEKAEDSIDCSTVFSSFHLFIVKKVRCFC